MAKDLFADQYPTESHGRIPGFASLEEEAEFWDTHDFTEFLDELEPGELRVSRDLSSSRPINPDEPENAEAT